MFSFHKPKIYRSNLGCCICKAKSSSSRFTDSQKYENEFERCFRIKEKRSGEICNACVLLVKRWKKLSPENRSIKHWHHVVDARAGPGTKLTGNRRIVAHHHAPAAANRSGSPSQHDSSAADLALASQHAGVTPLSSNNQANNQASGSGQTVRRRGGSFSNKARAIDTNVSTFTFGESPTNIYKRNYMTPETYSSSSIVASTGLSKPQSALNSAAFESVIKRFRQRQQQQKLEAQRRQLRNQQRMQQQQSSSRQNNKRHLPVQQEEANGAEQEDQQQPGEQLASKRVKRSSDSIGSISVDGLRVSSLLESSIWRKEKVCCGVIFRGLYNEVAVFPKLLKPCQCRQDRKLQQQRDEQLQEASREHLLNQRLKSASPPPRVNKSGSISSCGSNTSGTGSMELPIEELVKAAASARQSNSIQTASANTATGQRKRGRKSAETAASADEQPKSIPTTRRQVRQQRQQQLQANANESDSVASSAGSSSAMYSAKQEVHSPASIISTSEMSSESSRLLMDEDEEEEGILGEENDDSAGSSNTDDAASSTGSLVTDVERKKSINTVVGAMG